MSKAAGKSEDKETVHYLTSEGIGVSNLLASTPLLLHWRALRKEEEAKRKKGGEKRSAPVQRAGVATPIKNLGKILSRLAR